MHKDGKNSARELKKISVKTILSDCESGSKLPTDKLSNESQGSILFTTIILINFILR